MPNSENTDTSDIDIDVEIEFYNDEDDDNEDNIELIVVKSGDNVYWIEVDDNILNFIMNNIINEEEIDDDYFYISPSLINSVINTNTVH